MKSVWTYKNDNDKKIIRKSSYQIRNTKTLINEKPR